MSQSSVHIFNSERTRGGRPILGTCNLETATRSRNQDENLEVVPPHIKYPKSNGLKRKVQMPPCNHTRFKDPFTPAINWVLEKPNKQYHVKNFLELFNCMQNNT